MTRPGHLEYVAWTGRFWSVGAMWFPSPRLSGPDSGVLSDDYFLYAVRAAAHVYARHGVGAGFSSLKVIELGIAAVDGIVE